MSLCLVLSTCAVNNHNLCGGYTAYRTLDEQEVKLFCETYKGDIELEPYKVATQVVAGTNYRFKCKDPQKKIYIVTIYQPLPGQGDAEVTSVEKE